MISPGFSALNEEEEDEDAPARLLRPARRANLLSQPRLAGAMPWVIAILIALV